MTSTTHTINYTLDEKLTYRRIPFEVTSATSEIIIDFSPITPNNHVDLALESPSGFHGWSGGTEKQIRINSSHATPGYFKGIEPGTWHVALGLAKIQNDGEVEIKITCLESESKWYCGDLHMHSLHSDGDFSVRDVMSYVKEEGLEFISLTDHNSQTGFSEVGSNPPLIVIPGVELTTYKGHANVWDVKSPLRNILCDNVTQISNALEEATDAGYLVSINHPFCKDQWQWGFDLPYNFMEIWNGFWQKGNEYCLNYWHDIIKSGRKVIAVGGSDTHREEPKKWYGRPSTWIYSDAYSQAGIIAGLKSGRVCVCLNPRSPHVDLQIEDTFMGDIYESSTEDSCLLRCHIHQPNVDGSTIKIISSDDTIIEDDLKASDTCYEVQVTTSSSFYRVEIWKNDLTEPLAISNPIYIRK